MMKCRKTADILLAWINQSTTHFLCLRSNQSFLCTSCIKLQPNVALTSSGVCREVVFKIEHQFECLLLLVLLLLLPLKGKKAFALRYCADVYLKAKETSGNEGCQQ